MEFKTKIYNSTTIGNKTLKIEFRAEDLEEIKSLLNKVGIKTKEMFYGG